MLRFLRLQEGWLTVALLSLLLFSVTFSIEQAQWTDGLSILTPITIVGLLTGIILAKVRGVPRFLLDLVGLEIGLISVLLAVSSVMRDPKLVTLQDRVQDLLARTAVWINVAIRQDMSDDLTVFILSLAVVCWVLSYSSAYFVFKSRQLWWALVPNGIALLINLSYSPANLNGFIVIFMFSALLLMIRFNLLMKEERWQRERVNYSPALTWGFLWAGSLLSVLLASAMWFVPAASVNATLNGAWSQVNQPWLDFQTRMSGLWANVNGNTAIGGYSSFGSSFTMGGSLNLSNSVALIVKSQQRLYWRAMTYDTYTGIGWTDTSASTFQVEGLSPLLSLEANQRLVSQDLARQPVTYTVQVVNPKGDTIFASSRPVSLDTTSRLAVSWRKLDAQYSIDDIYNNEGGDLTSVPLELRSLVGLLHEAQRELRQSDNTDNSGLDPLGLLYATSKGRDIQQQVADLSRRGINVTFVPGPAPDFRITLYATGQVPVYDDITAVRSVQPVPRNGKYQVVSEVSGADAAELRAASRNYEQWVKDRYLTLPATVPQSVRDLAQKIVSDAGATNPYDQAKAIETYVRANYKYSTSIPLPPSGVDRVEWFLFQGKEGYCEYYASAMIVMLRSLGVPVRMATGYAPGTYDPKTQSFIVRESSAHAWPEVYFPSYGWIGFEPTPSQPVISRDVGGLPTIDDTQAEQTPEPTPNASPTPRGDNSDPQNSAAGTTTGSGGGNITLGAVAAVVLAAVIAVIALLLWLPASPWTRRKRAPGDADFYYRRMLLWARLMRVGPSIHHTPFEFGEALAREVPGTAMLTRTIARAYVRQRYGRAPLAEAERLNTLSAWAALRARLLRRLPSSQARHLRPGKRT